MTPSEIVLDLLTQQPRTRHEIQVATSWSRAKVESVIHRLRVRQQIEARRLDPVRPLRRPGVYGRPPRPSCVYEAVRGDTGTSAGHL